MAVFSPYGNGQFMTPSGAPAVGYKIFTYLAGSSTPVATYTDAGGLTSQTNPIILDSLGQVTNGQLWLAAGVAYKFIIQDAFGAMVDTVDNITGVSSATSSINQFQASGVTPTYVSATSFTLAGDQTTEFHVGRRLQFTVTAGVVYGTIATSAYTTLTTVTMTMDKAMALDAGLSSVSLSILRADRLALPVYQPVFSVYQTVSQVVTSGAPVKVNISTKEYDTHNLYNIGTNQAIPNIPGYWEFNGQINGAYSGTGLTYPMIYKNGVSVAQGTSISNGNGGVSTVTITVSVNGSTDYIELAGAVFGTTPSFAVGAIPVSGRFQGKFLRPL